MRNKSDRNQLQTIQNQHEETRKIQLHQNE